MLFSKAEMVRALAGDSTITRTFFESSFLAAAAPAAADFFIFLVDALAVAAAATLFLFADSAAAGDLSLVDFVVVILGAAAAARKTVECRRPPEIRDCSSGVNSLARREHGMPLRRGGAGEGGE